MRITRTFLVVCAASVAGACGHTSSPVAPPDGASRSDVIQAASVADSAGTQLRGVYTLGSGN